MADEIAQDPAWVPEFLSALAATGVVKQARMAAGVGQGTVYDRRRFNRRFAEQWEVALAASPLQIPSRARARRKPRAERASGPARGGSWRSVFLQALAETSNITASAARANVPLGTVYKLRRTDAAFAAQWQVALQEGYDGLEMELLGYLRDPKPERKMDVAAALRLLAAHRQTAERRRALALEDDEQATLDSIDRFIEDMRQRRLANAAILLESLGDDGAA